MRLITVESGGGSAAQSTATQASGDFLKSRSKLATGWPVAAAWPAIKHSMDWLSVVRPGSGGRPTNEDEWRGGG